MIDDPALADYMFVDAEDLDDAAHATITARGALIESNEEPQEYFRVPTNFGNLRINHIMYASWFAIFSANTSPSEPPNTVKSWLNTHTRRPSIVT